MINIWCIKTIKNLQLRYFFGTTLSLFLSIISLLLSAINTINSLMFYSIASSVGIVDALLQSLWEVLQKIYWYNEFQKIIDIIILTLNKVEIFSCFWKMLYLFVSQICCIAITSLIIILMWILIFQRNIRLYLPNIKFYVLLWVIITKRKSKTEAVENSIHSSEQRYQRYKKYIKWQIGTAHFAFLALQKPPLTHWHENKILILLGFSVVCCGHY